MTDTTERFSDRVEDCIRYRPGYPEAVIDLLVSHCGLNGDAAHQSMFDCLNTLFECHQQHGQISFDYDCQVFYGHLR